MPTRLVGKFYKGENIFMKISCKRVLCAAMSACLTFSGMFGSGIYSLAAESEQSLEKEVLEASDTKGEKSEEISKTNSEEKPEEQSETKSEYKTEKTAVEETDTKDVTEEENIEKKTGDLDSDKEIQADSSEDEEKTTGLLGKVKKLLSDDEEELDETEEELEELEELEEEKEPELEELQKTSKLKFYKDSDIDAVSSATTSKFSKEASFRSAKSYGGLYEDKFQGAAYLKPLDGEDEEGAFVAVGYTFGASDDPKWDFAANMEASPRYGHSYNEAIIVRYNSEHEVDWVWESDRVGVSYFLAVDVIKDGSIIAVGRARDYSSSRTALYLVKINPNDPDDYTEYIINSNAGAGYELNGIVTTEDGGFVVSGFTSFLNGYIASKAAGDEDFSEAKQIWQNADGEDEKLSKRASEKGYNGLLMKFDKDMNVRFVSFENYGVTEGVADSGYSSAVSKIFGVDIDEDGNYVTIGCTQLSKGNTNAVISKWDGKTGELISHRMAGTDDAMKQNSIDLIDARYLSVATLTDGTYVVTGTATNDATTSEGWKCYGSADVILVRYSADLSDVLFSRNIGTVDGLSGSLTATNGTQMEGVKATRDGGYVLYGSESSKVVEADLLEDGYSWSNYGSNDGVIIKYDSSNNVCWCQNYGTSGGDWIYDVIFRQNETEITVVGQSSGQYGTPAWEWHGQAASSTNPYDAFVMCTNMYCGAYTEPKASNDALSGVVWANGTYEGEGVGRGGKLTMEVVIENNKIASIECKSHSETTDGGEASPFARTLSLLSTIVSKQSAEVDSISGATLTSNGFKSGVNDALARASAQTVINAIEKVANYTSANTSNTGNVNNVLAAINYYTSLSDYERDYVTNSEALYNVAEIFGFSIEIENSEGEKNNESEESSSEDIDLNDTYWSLQNKYYRQINANGLMSHNLTGEGVKIAVIDSGIIGNSADLNYDHILAGWDYVNNVPMNDSSVEGSEKLLDPQGHGTLVAGIIAAKRDNRVGIAGLLSDVDLIPLRISSGTSEEESKIVAGAIIDAVDKFGANVITTSVSLADTEELKTAVAYAASKNVIIVGASGNSGVAGSTEDAYVYPAAYDDVIGVGAVDGNGTVRVNSTKNDQVFVTAPGQQIVSLGLSAKGYRCYVKSGTSYSAPIVAAMAAAAKQVKPEMTVADFKELLKNTSQDKGDEGFDNSYGYGIVDLAAFAEKIAPQPKPEEKVEEKEQEKTETKSEDKTEAKSEKKTETSSEKKTETNSQKKSEVSSGNSADTSISNSTSGEKIKNTAGTSSKTKKQEATDESDEKLEEDDIVQGSTVTEQAETTVEEEATESTEDEVTQISEEVGGFDSSSPIIPIVLIVLGLAVVAGFINKKR